MRASEAGGDESLAARENMATLTRYVTTRRISNAKTEVDVSRAGWSNTVLLHAALTTVPIAFPQVRSRLKVQLRASQRLLEAAVAASGLNTASGKLPEGVPPLPLSSASKYHTLGAIAEHANGSTGVAIAGDASSGGEVSAGTPQPLEYNPGSWRQRLSDFDFYPYSTARALRRWFHAKAAAAPPLPARLRSALESIVGSLWFEVLSMCLVFCNVFLLCLEEYGQSATRTSLLRDGNYVLTFMFFLEIMCRWGAAGRAYLDHGLNRAELTILVVSVLDVGAQFSGLVNRVKGLSALRAVRAVRVLRLVRLSAAWSAVLSQIASQVPAALYAVSQVACT